MKVDLHIHTTYSDGAFSPEMIVDTAIDCGLNVIALTDHDNILSYDIAQNYAKENDKKLEIIQGVEINTIYKGYEVHILGYFMDVKNHEFQNMLKFQQNARVHQAREMITLLNKKAGIRIKFDDIKKLVAEGGSIGRPHIGADPQAQNTQGEGRQNQPSQEGQVLYEQCHDIAPHGAAAVANGLQGAHLRVVQQKVDRQPVTIGYGNHPNQHD